MGKKKVKSWKPPDLQNFLLPGLQSYSLFHFLAFPGHAKRLIIITVAFLLRDTLFSPIYPRKFGKVKTVLTLVHFSYNDIY